MASTAEARRLTEAHRLIQARIGADTVRQMLSAWAVLDPENLDQSTAAWLRIAVSLIEGQRRASTAVASTYLTAFRVAELGAAVPPTSIVVVPASVQAITTSLTVTGPVSIKQAMTRGVDVAQAAETAKAKSARAAMRHSLDGGRGTVEATIREDRLALGWARATSGSPCAFCALMASRGPVYKSDRSASFQPHDGCACSPEPVYSQDQPWPTGSDRYAEVYDQAKAEDGDTMSNFRRLIEAT